MYYRTVRQNASHADTGQHQRQSSSMVLKFSSRAFHSHASTEAYAESTVLETTDEGLLRHSIM